MVCAAVLALALASPAAAESSMRLAQARSDVLPPHEILTILRSTALNPIGRPVRRGDTYVLRAIDEDYGDEVRVVVDARNGEILSMTPAAGGARTASPGAGIGSAEPMPPGAYRSGPPIIYEEGPPPGYGRPPAMIPGAIPAPPPGRYSSAPPTAPGAPLGVPVAPGTSASAPPSESQGLVAPGNDAGPLPAPPERFPQRAAPPPAAKPAPPPRRAAAAPPSSAPSSSSTPLPKPRPGGSVTQAAPPQADAAPLPPPIPLNPPGRDEVPH
jgi:hypothetical protein